MEDGDDIVLFLTLFERQSKRVSIEKRHWVSALLALIPSEINQLMARESEEKIDDYDYIKGLLLKRFKLSAEIFWQKSVETTCPVREQFVDNWVKSIVPGDVADKLDEYESVRANDIWFENARKIQKIPPHNARSNIITAKGTELEFTKEVVTARVSIPVSVPINTKNGIDDLRLVDIKYFESTKDKDIEFRKEGLRKETENETRIREAMHKEEEQARLKAEKETKAVEERRRMEEERRMNERIALEEEMRLKKERWLVEEQIQHVQKEHKMRMTEEQRAAERAQILNGDPDVVAQPVAVEEEKGLSRNSSNVPPISAEDVTYESKEKPKLPKRKLKELSRMSVTKLQQKVKLKASSNIVLVPQYWNFKREYSQDKRGIGKLAWELPGFIKRIGIGKVGQSLRERRSRDNEGQDEETSASASDGCFSNGGRSKTPLNHHVPDRPSNNALGIIQKGNTSTAQNELRNVAELS
ncbi:CCHC-type domain-containing protein [Trichonephila inaurata madagascariensis]|uniref:CCHC-type domain-containing protein n=1 Tax=Trichonephila inaurata madagascariensis TaxID=2747483 RepID=A0A8X6YUA5_9ARAC|nr:CCHC-type domain-containing protein [Trichonephila inaurata madagascariensis]